MGEIRRNPFTGEYIIVNEGRMARPVVMTDAPKECPFCPSSRNRHPNLPDKFDAIAFENLYPSLSFPSPINDAAFQFRDPSNLLESAPNLGRCEVVLYSDDHHVDFQYLPLDKAITVVRLWKNRYNELMKDPRVKYIFIFENHGKDVGVTNFHPHGQIYAFPFIPMRMQTIIQNCQNYFHEHSECLQCRLLEKEIEEKIRIIHENEDFITLAPFHATLPHECHVIPKRHLSDLAFTDEEMRNLALSLQDLRRRYDLLFQRKKSPNYMMMFFPRPVNVDLEMLDESFHFRVEFISLDRDSLHLKYRAAVETGLHTWTNDLSPETVAKKMRTLI